MSTALPDLLPLPSQGPLDGEGRLVHEDDDAAQLALALANVEAQLAAARLGPDVVTGRMLDYIEFDDGYAFAKTRPPRALIGRSLAGYGVRQEYGITVVGVKPHGEAFTYATPSTVLREGAEIIVSGPKDAVERFSALGHDVGPRTERRSPGRPW